MLFSIAIILLSGLTAGWVCQKIRFPGLFGMILAGIVISPYVLNLLDGSILEISADIRKIALIIILLRAGITLNLSDLKKVGRPAVMMCFVPACLEILGMLVIAPPLLGVARLDAAIMGAVVGAVSPAVIVPRMIKLIEEKYGTEKGIPQLILAGASVDDVFVIVLFGVFTKMAQGGAVSVITFVKIPITILSGIIIGAVAGKILGIFFQHTSIRHTIQIVILLSIACIFTALEDRFSGVFPFSSLISVMFTGIFMNRQSEVISRQISAKLNKMWAVAEIFLFVLVGASVNISSVSEYGWKAVILIFAVLLFRMVGVLICLTKTRLRLKEKLFCVIAYMPKATVQAAIGGIPLAMGLGCGNIVLTVSVLAILVTAPLGAFGIDMSYKRMLCKENS